MMRRNLRVAALGTITGILSLTGVTLCAQEKPAPTAKKLAIRAGRLIDGKSEKPIENALILIEGDKIVSVTSGHGTSLSAPSNSMNTGMASP